MGERRFDLRLPVEESVDLLWQDRAGQSQSSASILADISVSGAAVRVRSPVQVGAKVSFGFQNQTLVGKVKHCARQRASYLLGIEFEADCCWSLRPQ
jgi:hypothetical protein